MVLLISDTGVLTVSKITFLILNIREEPQGLKDAQLVMVARDQGGQEYMLGERL